MNSGMNSSAKIFRQEKIPGVYTLSSGFRGADLYLFYFLLTLPLINAIADSTIYYFIEADVRGGYTRGSFGA